MTYNSLESTIDIKIPEGYKDCRLFGTIFTSIADDEQMVYSEDHSSPEFDEEMGMYYITNHWDETNILVSILVPYRTDTKNNIVTEWGTTPHEYYITTERIYFTLGEFNRDPNPVRIMSVLTQPIEYIAVEVAKYFAGVSLYKKATKVDNKTTYETWKCVQDDVGTNISDPTPTKLDDPNYWQKLFYPVGTTIIIQKEM